MTSIRYIRLPSRAEAQRLLQGSSPADGECSEDEPTVTVYAVADVLGVSGVRSGCRAERVGVLAMVVVDGGERSGGGMSLARPVVRPMTTNPVGLSYSTLHFKWRWFRNWRLSETSRFEVHGGALYHTNARWADESFRTATNSESEADMAIIGVHVLVPGNLGDWRRSGLGWGSNALRIITGVNTGVHCGGGRCARHRDTVTSAGYKWASTRCMAGIALTPSHRRHQSVIEGSSERNMFLKGPVMRLRTIS